MAIDIGTALTKKLGPVPVWVYGAVVAMGAWGWYLWKGRGVEGDDGQVSFPTPDGADAGIDYTSDTGINGSGLDGSGTVRPGNTAPTDNLAWYHLAVNDLVARGYDPVLSSNAINKFLQGLALSLAERALVNMALSKWGSPPEGAPESPGANPTPPTLPDNNHPGPNTPPPPRPNPLPRFPDFPRPVPLPTPIPPRPVPTPVPAQQQITHVVKSGDTLWGISNKYWGNGNYAAWIYNNNTAVIEAAAKSHGRANSDGGHWIYPGTTLRFTK